MTFALLSHARSSTEHHRCHQDSRFILPSALPMVSLSKQRPCDLVRNLSLPLPRQVRHSHPVQRLLCSHRLVPPEWGHIQLILHLPTKGVLVSPQKGTHSAIGADPRAGRGPFPKPRPVVLPMVNFGQTKPAGLGHIHNADSDLVHLQFRLSVLQWNPGPTRRKPTNIIAATCGRFHAVISQEASDHVPHITDQFIAYTGKTDLAILLNEDTFEPNPAVFAFGEASTSKDTWGMVLLIVRGLLRRRSLSGTPTVTFCSGHIHNVVAK